MAAPFKRCPFHLPLCRRLVGGALLGLGQVAGQVPVRPLLLAFQLQLTAELSPSAVQELCR